MKEILVAQHLGEVQFGIIDLDNDEWLGEPEEIEAFIDKNDPAVVAKAIVDGIATTLEQLKEALEKELRDCYESD